MKNNILIFLNLILLQSCTDSPTFPSIDEMIKTVETSLISPVYIQGDTAWTIDERMEHYGVPGVSLAVIYDYKIEWTKTYGVMDKETKTPVTSETLFQAGSISKPVAAYGALTLVEQNKITLDEDINTYLQSWKLPDSEFTKEKKVALKHLLNHSAGLTIHGFLGYSPDLPVPTLVQVLDGTPPANSGAIYVNKTPEESFRYSGGGYTVMQQMMIDVEDKSFPSLIGELVLQPLGMTNSTYDQPLKSAQLKMAATGYLPDGSMTKGKRHTYPEMAAAGLWTTAEDLAKFAINIQNTLIGESAQGLTPEMTNKMLTPFVEDFTGLGIFLNKIHDEIYFGHGGWDEGFSSELVAHKNKGYGVVVLTNSNHPEFISELIRAVALTYEWDEYVPTYQKMKPDQSRFMEISGRYRINGNRLIEVYQTKDLLYAKELGEEPDELVKISDSTFVTRKNNRLIQFIPDSESERLGMITLDPISGSIESNFAQIKDDERLPIEFMVAGDFEKGLLQYQALLEEDPNDPTIAEDNLNSVGYHFLNSENIKLSQDIFKVNMLLYPNSSNVYDSYAEACMKNGDLDLAIKNYEKSLKLDPENNNAKDMILEIQEMKGN